MNYSFTDLFSFLVDFIIHIDTHLQLLAAQYGLWLYGILFLIVFCETGLVVTPFLPGDSLLFAAGSLASMPDSSLNPHLLFVLFFSAALLGDNLNYLLGHKLGPKVFNYQKSRFLILNIWSEPIVFLKNMEARPSSSPVLFLLSELLLPSLPE